VLNGMRIDPASYHHAATLTYTFDEYTNEYLRRAIGIAAANRIYRDEVPSAFWAVRYFRDSQKEEYLVVLQPDGALHSVHHTLDEKAPGANLPKEEAQARAETYLRDEKKVDLAGWNLVETHSDKKPARTDHVFEWEQKSALDSGPNRQAGDGAHIRMQLAVLGDEVSDYRIFIKIPETWLDKESRRTPLQIAQGFVGLAGLAVAVIAVIVVFLRNLKGPEVARVPWRPLAKISGVLLFAAMASYVNRAPLLLLNYATAMPLATYYITLGLSFIFVTALYAAAGILLLGLGWFFLERAFGPGKIPAWKDLSPAYFRDAFCLGVFGSAAVMGLNRLPALFARWPLLRHSLGESVPENLDLLQPAVGALSSSIVAAFLTVGLLAIAASLIALYVRPKWMRAGLMAAYAVAMATNMATPGAFLREAAYHLVAVVTLWYGVKCIARFNALGYFLLAATIVLVPAAIELLEQPSPYLHASGYAIVACAVALLAWPLIKWRTLQPARPL
jgi:hypothetical protein